MSSAERLQRITVRPKQCGGRPCIRGMHIRVIDVLELLAAGESKEQILEDFPDLETDDIAACLLYAARRLDHPNVVAYVVSTGPRVMNSGSCRSLVCRSRRTPRRRCRPGCPLASH